MVGSSRSQEETLLSGRCDLWQKLSSLFLKAVENCLYKKPLLANFCPEFQSGEGR